MNRLLTVILLFAVMASAAPGQDESLDELLDKEAAKRIEPITATFKSTRIISGHSIERMPAGELDFRVSHRFDRLNKGFYEFFGLDESSSLISLELGLTDWLMVGIGRATVKKYFNSFAKFSLLRQTTGASVIPVTVSAVIGAGVFTTELDESDPRNPFESRLAYTYQLLIARKFSDNFSLQFAPTLIHRNIVSQSNSNDVFALGVAGRYKTSSWVAVCFEYFPLMSSIKDIGTEYYSPFGIGFDIETGGHVFQLHFTNSISMVEPGFIGETTGNWLKGDIHIGFNISRVFTLF